MFRLASAYKRILNWSLAADLVTNIFLFGWFVSLIAVEVAGFQFGSMTSRFYFLLPQRDWPAVKQLIGQFAYLLVLMSMAKAVVLGVQGLLARAMRRNLTHRLHQKYCHLLRATGTLEGADQRICEDADRVSSGLLKVFEVFVLAPALIIWYSMRVSALLSPLSVSLIFAHFGVSWLILKPALSRLRLLIKKKEQREAQLRSEHVNIVDNRAAMLTAAPTMLTALKSNLNFILYRTLFATKQLILTEGSIEGLKSFIAYSGSLLCFSLMIGEITWGRWKDSTSMELVQMISMTGYVTLYLFFQLGRIVGIVDELGILNGQVERLDELICLISQEIKQDAKENSMVTHDHIAGSVAGKLWSPNGMKCLVESVRFEIKSFQHVLICGPHGVGKTTLLTAIHSNSFPIEWKSAPSHIMLCPQSPLIFTGSVMDLLGQSKPPAPSAEDSVPVDEESPAPLLTCSSSDLDEFGRLKWAFEAVNLPAEELLSEPDRTFTIEEWRCRLTPGQWQRFALARILLSQPPLALLDETLCGLSAEETEKLLQLFTERGTTIIASSHSEVAAFPNTLYLQRKT